MIKRICNIITLTFVVGLIWHCGDTKYERIVSTETASTSKPGGRPLSKLAVSHGESHRLIVVTVYKDSKPVAGARVEFSRSIAGQVPSYQWSGITDDEGIAEVEISEITGYYHARALLGDEEVGRWSSIPINETDVSGKDSQMRLHLPVGKRAYVPIPSQREALIAFYNACGGPDWTKSTNWLSDREISSWQGVTATDGWVTSLVLWESNLSGNLPEELTRLRKLEVLSLVRNQLSGEIPAELGNLPNLEVLILGINALSGEIPVELVNLSNLKRLQLGSNELSGEIPSELGNLSNLEWLILSSNELSGGIPVELGNLSHLKRLQLGSNQLSGEIPSELGNLNNLERLILDNNQLSGEIPSELGNLTNLTYLDLRRNRQLSGSIPTELGNLTNLTYLNLHTNQLSGEIPVELGNLTNLELLFLANSQLSGEIPSELGNLTNLERLFLYNNQLSGEIPSELGNLTNLEWLWLNSNTSLTGVLPQSLTKLTKLERFSFGGTGLCAPLDPAFQAWLKGIAETSGENCSE